eukprot:TRINITY_DN47152_c0_g1_i1.p1 TRINITY_DN47152_c0_g1~~TRINITY_DN47152_c0_g1_i1.p1  ORF type:complete len:645 (+),score=206.88 TRINITY_DN47152_c0_g1_i1:94-1935(+)
MGGGHSQQLAAASGGVQQGLVHIQGVPLHSHVPAGTTSQRMPVLFEVDAALPDGERRPPFELCICLDRSGSMAGGKLRSAKTAVNNIIDALGEGDVLHLVCYDSDVQVSFTNGTRDRAEELHELVNQVTAGSTTNTSGAIQRAQEVLAASGERAGINKRIFLMSDGRANVGISDFDGLRNLAQSTRADGTIISAFGIGADFDERIMKAIAESGRGSYHFLREAVVRQSIENAMAALQRTIGAEAAIHVSGVAPSGRLLQVYRPQDEDGAGTAAGDAGVVRVGDLRAGGHKQLLVVAEVSVPPGTDDGAEVPLLNFELKWKSAEDGSDVVAQGSVAVRVGSASETAPQVRVADTMQRLEGRIEQFVALMEQGDREHGVALQREVIAELEEVEPLDTRGYVTAQLRRLNRVREGVEQGTVSFVQARMMVGEAFERQNSGDLDGILSPVGSPLFARGLPGGSPGGTPAAFPFPGALQMGYPMDNAVSPTYMPGAFFPESPPDSPSQALRSPLMPPSNLLADTFDRASLPAEFLCPITKEVMTDPVVAQDGYTYERAAIVRWFAEGNSTSPHTGAPLPGHLLIPNHAIRAQIMSENDRRRSAAGGSRQPEGAGGPSA